MMTFAEKGRQPGITNRNDTHVNVTFLYKVDVKTAITTSVLLRTFDPRLFELTGEC